MSTADDDPDPRPLRRNDIVYDRTEENNGGHWAPFGRVWKRSGPGRFWAILCTRNVIERAETDLQRVIYVGRWDTRWDSKTQEVIGTYFRYMATLRRLKQMAAYYHPEVWKDRKPDRYARHLEKMRLRDAENLLTPPGEPPK